MYSCPNHTLMDGGQTKVVGDRTGRASCAERAPRGLSGRRSTDPEIHEQTTPPLTGIAKHPTPTNVDMTLQRMDHVDVVVDDLDAATAFFVELGMELEGEAPVEGRWVDRVVGLDDVRVDIAMMRTPDGHGWLELTKFHTPTAISAEPENAPANTLAYVASCSPSKTLRTSLPASTPTVPSSLASWTVRGQLSALLRPRPGGHHRRTGRAAQLRDGADQAHAARTGGQRLRAAPLETRTARNGDYRSVTTQFDIGSGCN